MDTKILTMFGMIFFVISFAFASTYNLPIFNSIQNEDFYSIESLEDFLKSSNLSITKSVNSLEWKR